MREILGYTIDDVFRLNICVFLNYAIYIRSKANVEKVQIKEMERKMKK